MVDWHSGKTLCHRFLSCNIGGSRPRVSREGQQQQPTSQKSPGGSLKQVPPLGVLLRFLTSQVGYLTREKYDLIKPRHSGTPMIWAKDSQKHDPFADKKTCYLNSL